MRQPRFCVCIYLSDSYKSSTIRRLWLVYMIISLSLVGKVNLQLGAYWYHAVIESR